MSAFLVGDDVIDKVVDLVMPDESQLKKLTLGRLMLHMNHEALHARYGDPVPLMVDIDYVPEPVVRNKAAQLKALHCLLYQCSEGDVPNKPLFNTLAALSNSLAPLTSIPEYEAAPWG